MNEGLRQKILAEYPEWHSNPLRLTASEMKNPPSVISFFFECYDLPTIRACLKEWLEDALSGTGNNAGEHIYTYNDVEKLVEAAYLLNKSGKLSGKSKKKK
jgi:hypothetical protein